jgi:hypothetical protein
MVTLAVGCLRTSDIAGKTLRSVLLKGDRFLVSNTNVALLERGRDREWA